MHAACYADRAPENRRDRVRPRVFERRRTGLVPAAREWTYLVEEDPHAQRPDDDEGSVRAGMQSP
eukprot:64470-Alexandrium_andersonii.AAC.1